MTTQIDLFDQPAAHGPGQRQTDIEALIAESYDQHPNDPDNYWTHAGLVICAHCGREYQSEGPEAFDPLVDKCSDDCPQYDL